jgi:hypothetical protein
MWICLSLFAITQTAWVCSRSAAIQDIASTILFELARNYDTVQVRMHARCPKSLADVIAAIAAAAITSLVVGLVSSKCLCVAVYCCLWCCWRAHQEQQDQKVTAAAANDSDATARF